MNEGSSNSNGWITMQTLVVRLKFVCFLLAVVMSAELIPVSALAGDVKIKVENIRVERDGERFVILYDLTGPKDEEYAVRLSLRREGDPKFRMDLSAATGDLGKGAYSGRDRKIVWDQKKEFPDGLTGADFFFVVDAEVSSGGISPWVWIGGGAVAAGLAVVLLGSKKSDGTTSTGPTATSSQFPVEPGRPY
jgi:hypothetical protein